MRTLALKMYMLTALVCPRLWALSSAFKWNKTCISWIVAHRIEVVDWRLKSTMSAGFFVFYFYELVGLKRHVHRNSKVPCQEGGRGNSVREKSFLISCFLYFLMLNWNVWFLTKNNICRRFFILFYEKFINKKREYKMSLMKAIFFFFNKG